VKQGINFNRPALLAAAQAAKRRTILVSLAASYLVLLAVLATYLCVLGFLTRQALVVAQTTLVHTRTVENENASVLQVDPAFLEMMHQVSGPDKCWVPRLARLGQLLPPNAWIVRLEGGSANSTLGDGKRRRLSINVSATTRTEEDKILFPVHFVQTLQQDSLFATGYTDIHFASTRVLTGTQATVVNFDVECK
jgi:hypothetical protein